MTDISPELLPTTWRSDFKHELNQILEFWMNHAPDDAQGGFHGELGDDGTPKAGAIRGSVLNARILWTFSAAYNLNGDERYLAMAQRAFTSLRSAFIDPVHGGVYWSVTAHGRPDDLKKQIYALSFAIYGLAEFYKAEQDQEALDIAVALYNSIERHSYDPQQSGYFEAFSRDWGHLEDLRLSDKDANEKKTMNTHLHVLEAYTNLYRIWPDAQLAIQLRRLIIDFETHIINRQSGHLYLFFDENWQVKSDTLSYGHDIEASWLLVEAAEALHDPEIISRIKQTSIAIAVAAAKGLNDDGSMNYEYEPATDHLIGERHWWVQAEAVVGYYNAFQISGEKHFLDKALAVWNYTIKKIIDHDRGEWHWGRQADDVLMGGYGKGGFWKCPYHNGRACIEMIQRLSQYQ